MPRPQVLTNGLVLGESPRWHDDRLWLCDWAAHEVLTVDRDGTREVVVTVDSFPFCIDWLPDGRLIVVDSRAHALRTFESDGTLRDHADLTPVSTKPWNEIVVDARGAAYVNTIGFDMMGGETPGMGVIAVLMPDGGLREVAGDLQFPNGMAVTPDGRTLIVAESYARCLTAFDIEADGSLSNRREWAALAGSPDGICLDAEGAVWCAVMGPDDPGMQCARVAEGGEVRQQVALDLPCFAVMLGGPSGTTLFMVANEWNGPEGVGASGATGCVYTLEVRVPRAGHR